MQLLQTLRDSGDDTPFIFLTGHGNKQIEVKAKLSGADDYYTKDTGMSFYEDLLDGIRKVTSDHHSRRSTAGQARQDAEGSGESAESPAISTISGDLFEHRRRHHRNPVKKILRR